MIKLRNILNESGYFLDKFKGKELSSQQYSQINRELKHLKFGLKDLCMECIQIQNNGELIQLFSYYLH